MELELSEICRACLKPSDVMESLFTETGKSLIQKFEFLSIKLSNKDVFPRGICEFCKSKLLVSYQFAKEVADNQEQLSQQLIDFNSEVEVIQIIEEEPETKEIASSPPKTSRKTSPKKKKAFHLDKSIKSEKTILDGKPVYKKECPICHTMQKNLKQHLIVHSGIRKHKCEVCSKSFSQLFNLNIHLKLHDPEKGAKERHKCEICGTTFTDPRSLRRHGAKHSGERKFKCDVCSKGFLYSHNLVNHKRSHLQDKRYKCEEEGCGKAFVTSGELSRHRNSHEKKKNKKDVKTYECFI